MPHFREAIDRSRGTTWGIDYGRWDSNHYHQTQKSADLPVGDPQAKSTGKFTKHIAPHRLSWINTVLTT